jgi:hypothetical protein
MCRLLDFLDIWQLKEREYFQMFVDMDLEKYVADQLKLTRWGGEPEIKALAEAYNKRVRVYKLSRTSS